MHQSVHNNLSISFGRMWLKTQDAEEEFEGTDLQPLRNDDDINVLLARLTGIEGHPLKCSPCVCLLMKSNQRLLNLLESLKYQNFHLWFTNLYHEVFVASWRRTCLVYCVSVCPVLPGSLFANSLSSSCIS